MTYKGHVEGGKVVFDEPADLEDGTPVRIEVTEMTKDTRVGGTLPAASRSLAERFASVIGTAEGLPEDAAKNVDHYLYGTPKKP